MSESGRNMLNWFPTSAGSGTTLYDYGDSSGNNGTITGATWVPASNGRWALLFSTDDVAVTGITGTVASWMLWWKPSQTYNTGAGGLLIGSNTSFNIETWIGGYGSDFANEVITVVDAISSPYQATYITNANLPDGQFTSGTWYHIACCYNGTRIVIYINGIEYTNGTYNGGADNQWDYPTEDLTLMERNNGVSHINGTIADVRLYDINLTVEDVRRIFRQTYRR